MRKAPGLRTIFALSRDVRAAIVGAVVIVAFTSGGVVLHDHLKIRAWIAVVAGAVVLLGVLALDWLRFRERERAIRLEGALAESRRMATEATTEHRPNVAAEEILRSIDALRLTLIRRSEPYGGNTTTLNATADEIMRSRVLVRQVRIMIGSFDSDTADLLNHFEQPSQAGPPSVAMLLSGMDHMEAQVMSWGVQYEHSGPAPRATATQVVTTPTHTVVIRQP